MALGWLTAFKEIPWSKVISVTPTIVEGGKKLWSMVGKREAEASTASGSLGKPPATPADAIAALEIRVRGIQTKVDQLNEEAVSSFAVVRSLTEQHSQLVAAVDVLIARTRVLWRVCILLVVALVALLAFALIR